MSLVRRISIPALLFVANAAFADIVFQDGFDGGTYDMMIYEATGGACLEVLGLCQDRSICDPGGSPCSDGSDCSYKLVVHVVEDTDSGVRIHIPDPPLGVGSPKCLRMTQDIDPEQFPVGQTWRHTVVMINDDTQEETGFQLQALRPAWNRCAYELTNRTSGAVQEVQVFTPTQGDTAKFECPNFKDVVFDWLPGVCTGEPTTKCDPANPNCPVGQECKPGVMAEVTSKEAQAILDKFKCLFQKASDIEHNGGGPIAFRITKWQVTKGWNTGHD